MLLKLLVRLLLPPKILTTYTKESISIANQYLVPIITLNFIFGLIVFWTYFGLMFLVFKLAYERQTQDILLGFIGLPIVCYFFIGMVRFYLALVRKAKIKIALFMVGYKKYFNILILFCLYYSVYVLLIKIIADISEYEGIMKIRIILGFFGFIWIVIRLIFSPIFVIDKGYNARRALKASFLMTSGKTLKTLILILLSITVFLTGAILFAVGIFYTFGLFMIAMVIAYDINLRNRFSRRKKIINETAVETKRALEDSAIFQAIPISKEDEEI
ncbi:MAG: hypothetical protein H7A24_12930 [Leptospiraceae bacterium]|nr:hypothetical protein [Leptospiraceae bacterium]MCP5512781.1 hypothetical protein [Leptospiraceae bacterium]